MLLFKKKFLEQIKRGQKTQTIRLWNYRRMKSGQRSYVPGIGYVAIVSVEPVELTGLTDDDAALDGFPSAESLRNEICTLYPEEVLENLTPFKVRFSVYPPDEQQEIAEERRRTKQKEKQQKSLRQDEYQQIKDAHQQEYVSQTLEKIRKMGEMNEAG